MDTRKTYNLEIDIRQIGQGPCFLQHQGDVNGTRLSVNVQHSNRGVAEALENIGSGWCVELERKSTDATVPYVLKLLKKKPEGSRSGEFLQFNIQSTSEGDSNITVTGGRVQANTSLVLRCDNLRVTHNFSSDGVTSFVTSRGHIRLSSNVRCPVLFLSACEGKENVVLMSEGNLICNALKVTAKKLYVDGKISSQVSVLKLVVWGNLHVSTHGIIGQCHGKNVQGRLVATILDIAISGDIQNYGRMVSASLVKLKCRNYISGLESKEETVQKGYSAIKTRDIKTAPGFRGIDQVATIKELHTAVKSLNKQKVAEFLENGADPRALIGKKEKFAKSAIDVAKSQLAKSQMVSHMGQSDSEANGNLKAAKEIVDMLNWWDSMRGDIVSKEGIEICCEQDLEDCSQLKSPQVILKVKGNAIVEQGSFWSCGVVSGLVEGKMQIDGTWKLKQFASLDIQSDLVTSLSGRVIVADGGRVITHETFQNQDTWFNQSGLLCIECDVMSQEDWATVWSQQDLEVIVNGKTSEQWFGEVKASGSVKITSRHNVQCHADVTSPILINVVLESDKQDVPVSLEVAGRFQVVAGPVIVESQAPGNFCWNQFVVSGNLQSCSLQASNVHSKFISNSVTDLKPMNEKCVFLQAGKMDTHEQSQINMEVDNENQTVVVLCEDAWIHEGLLHAQSIHGSAVSGEFIFHSMINRGRVEGFSNLKIDVAHTFENHAELNVPDKIMITGEGVFTNTNELVATLLGINISGDIQNYGRMESASLAKVKCRNYKSCIENKQETVQKGYSAIPSRDMKTAWDSMRGEFVSKEGIEICCEQDLEDCSQLKSPKVILKVKGDAFVEQGSFWSCGVVSGVVEGKMQIDGSWELEEFASLDIQRDLVTSLSGQVIVADGGRVITHETFQNRNTWFNQSGSLCIECDVMSQENQGAVSSQQDLEVIVNGKTSEQWFGEVKASGSVRITSRHNVQCHADVTSPRFIHVVLESDKQDVPVSLEVAGRFQVVEGPVIVDSQTPGNFCWNQFVVSGNLQSCSLQASNVHTKFISNSVIYLKPMNEKHVLLKAGKMDTHEQSQINMEVDNEKQSVVVLCEDAWIHEGLLQAHSTHGSAVSGEFIFPSMINRGRVEGFSTLKMNVAETFENHAELNVLDKVVITGEGVFTNENEGTLICNNGPLVIDELRKVYLKPQSCTFGDDLTMNVNGCLFNEGRIKARKDASFAVDAINNKNGVISSEGGDILITWLDEDAESIIDGVVRAPYKLVLTTHSKTSITIRCASTNHAKSENSPELQIPLDGMTVTSPLACVIVDSCLFGKMGNEIVSLATGNGCVFHSKSDIPNFSVALGPKVTDDHVYVSASGDEALLQLHQVVVVSRENASTLALKGNVCLEHGGAIVSSNVDLISDACLTLKGSGRIQMRNIIFTTSSVMKLPNIYQLKEDCRDDQQTNNETTSFTLKAKNTIDLMGLVTYENADDNKKNTFILTCEATDVTIRNGSLNIPFLEMMVTNKLLVTDGGVVAAQGIAADVGVFKMEETCCLTVSGTEESIIYVKDEKAHIEGSLITQGNGTLVIHSKEDIVLGNLKCEQANANTQFESMGSITLSKNCDIKVLEGVIVLKSTMEEGTISVNGKIVGHKSSKGSLDTGNDKRTDRLVIESFIIKLQDTTMEDMGDLSVSAENILEVTREAHVFGCRNVTIEAKVFQMDGKISEIDNLEIRVWSSVVKGSVECCGEVKITSELLLVNSGFIQGKKIGVITPVLLSIPDESANASCISVPQIGNEKTEILVIEGLLSLWTKSIKHARNIDLKSMLHFEFSSETSTLPSSKNLDNWKRGMENILQPAAAPNADMQSLLNEASKLQKVACQLGTASLLCQGVMGISKNIQENGVQQFQMTDLVGVMGTAHVQYTNINSFKTLLNTDPLLKKLKKGAASAKKLLSNLWGKLSFSNTLKFQDVDPSSAGSVRETTWISKRSGDSGVHTDGSYMVESQLWENRSSLEACGDIIISSAVITHCGSQNRAMKACRILLYGDDINVCGLRSSETKAKGSKSVKVVDNVSDQLHAEGENVTLESSEVHEIANVHAKEQANIQDSDINVLNAEGNDVNVTATTVRHSAQVIASNQANIEKSTIENVHAEGRNVSVKLTTVHGVAELDATEKANIKGSDIEYLKASGESVAVDSTKVQDYADIDAKKSASIEKSDINSLSAKGDSVSMQSTKVHDTAVVIASNKANVSDVEAGNLDVEAENDVHIADVKVKSTLVATSKNKDVKTTGDVKAKNAALLANKGTVEFDKSNKYAFETLALKQKAIASKDLHNLLDKSGAYSSLKVSDQLDLAVDDHVTMDACMRSFLGLFSYEKGVDIDHGFSLEAKSINLNSNIHSNKNLAFTANEGDINVGSKKVIDGDSVQMTAEKDIVHHSGSTVKAKKDVIEKSTDGSITTHGATVSGGRYVELDAAKDINILAEGGYTCSAKKSSVLGGTGYEYKDNEETRRLGLKLKAGENLTVDASSVSSQGDNLITAGKNIVFKPRSHRYCSKRTTKKRFLGLWSTTTEEWSTHVDRAEIFSSGGRNIIEAKEGSVTSTATNIRAQENRIIAKGPVTLQDLVTKTEKFSNTSDCFGGLFYKNLRHETHNVSHGTIVRDESAYANTIIMSKSKDINVIGSEIDTEGNLALIAEKGNVNIKERVLDHHVEDHTSGLYVKVPDDKSGFGIGYHYTRTEEDYQDIAGKEIKAKGSVLVKAKELNSDVSYDVAGDMILDVEKTKFSTQELKSKTKVDSVYLQMESGASGYRASLNYDHSDEVSSTRAMAGLNVGGTLHAKGDSFRADQGYDLNVGENLVLDVNRFAVTGAQDRHASVSHHGYIAVEGTEAEIGYDLELSASIVNRNQKTNVGGKIIANNVKEGVIDGANVDCNEIEGRIDNLTVESRQDRHEKISSITLSVKKLTLRMSEN